MRAARRIHPNNPLGHSATFVTIGTPIIQQHSVDWDGSDGFPQQSYTFDDAQRGNGNGVIDVGDLGTQVARSSAKTQEMDLDEFDLRWTSDYGQPPRRRRQLPHERGVREGRTHQQDLGSWGISNPRDVELFAPGVVETFCLSCRFDDFAVGQADVAFKGDAAELYRILTPIYEARGNAVSVNTTEDWVEEDIMASAQFQMETSSWAGRRITAACAAETDVSSKAVLAAPTDVLWTADNDLIALAVDA
jgi:hypothetical protein